MAKRTVTDVKWLCETTTGVLARNQGVLYVSPQAGLGMTHPYGHHTDKTPQDAIDDRYSGHKTQDLVFRAVVYEQSAERKINWDDKVRARIHELHMHDRKLYPFDAYNKLNNPAPSGNTEALIGYDHGPDSAHWPILLSIISEVLGLSPVVDNREPWIPRDAGKIYGQDLMVDELAKKLNQHRHVGFNGHTGLAKTMIVAACLQSKLMPSGGALVLYTSPIGDTLNDVANHYKGYRYQGSDLARSVEVYTEKDLAYHTIADLRKEADSGVFVVLALTVQDVRYQDDAELETKSVREKYSELSSVKIDAWHRDEVQSNYQGAVTSTVFAQLDPDLIIDTSASLNKLVDLYHPDAIVDRGLFWSLRYQQARKTPQVWIETLGGLDFENLHPTVAAMFDPEEGWSPIKMTECAPNGQLKHLSGFDYILDRQYLNDDDKETNPLSICNDTDLPPESRRVGMHVLPQGVNGTPARKYVGKLADDLNSKPKWNTRSHAIFITPYDCVKHARSPSRKGPRQIIEDLLQEYQHVIILTHRMWTVGSNIPPIGHIVQWDPIRDPYTQEQLYPGRAYRTLPWKTAIKLYDLAPDHVLERSICDLARITAKLDPCNPDPKELLKNINFRHYDGRLGMISRSAADVYEPYNQNIKDRLQATLSEEKLAKCLGAIDVDLAIDENHVLTRGAKTQMTDATGAKTFAWQEVNSRGKNKGRPQTITPLLLAKKINAVMLELPAFAVLGKVFLITAAVDHWSIRQMFGDHNADMLLELIANNTALHNLMQDKLTDVHQAYNGMEFEEVHDYIFRNTTKKKTAGLVFINNEAARRFATDFVDTVRVPEDYDGIVVVLNALSGSVPYHLQCLLPAAKILCVETHPYYEDHLKKMGFAVINEQRLGDKDFMGKIKYWFMNPPYQKDAEGKNDESNKQGSHWFSFVERALTSPASTKDAKYCVVSPNSIFGAGGFGRPTFKVNQIRKHAEFAHVFPDLTARFPGVGIPICGWVIDKNKSTCDVTIEGHDGSFTIDGSVPVPFFVSPTSIKVLHKCWSQPYTDFVEKLRCDDDDAVIRVNGGRYKIWKKTFVGLEKDTDHNQQGAKIPADQIPGYRSGAQSQLWEYIFKVLGGEKGNSVTGLMKYMPVMPDMTRAYSDREWYDHYGVDADMQKDISIWLKNYK